MSDAANAIFYLLFAIALFAILGLAFRGYGSSKTEEELRKQGRKAEERATKAEQRVKELEEELRISKAQVTIEAEQEAAKEAHAAKAEAREEAINARPRKPASPPPETEYAKIRDPITYSHGKLHMGGRDRSVVLRTGREGRIAGSYIIEASVTKRSEPLTQIRIGVKDLDSFVDGLTLGNDPRFIERLTSERDEALLKLRKIDNSYINSKATYGLQFLHEGKLDDVDRVLNVIIETTAPDDEDPPDTDDQNAE